LLDIALRILGSLLSISIILPLSPKLVLESIVDQYRLAAVEYIVVEEVDHDCGFLTYNDINSSPS
jgi:hypothetical protein